MIDVRAARRQMVEQQVRAWSVLDLKVLEVMDRVAREQFVPAAFRDLAYADMYVPMGHGQSMLAPKIEGRILQSLEIQPQDRALEVGTGSGYFAACLTLLARSVIDRDHARARGYGAHQSRGQRLREVYRSSVFDAMDAGEEALSTLSRSRVRCPVRPSFRARARDGAASSSRAERAR